MAMRLNGCPNRRPKERLVTPGGHKYAVLTMACPWAGASRSWPERSTLDKSINSVTDGWNRVVFARFGCN